MTQLRDYQKACLDKSLERYQQGVNRQLCVLATGLGKAVLFAALRAHHGFQKRVMVLVHREELAAQAADKLFTWNPGLTIGVEMSQRRAKLTDTHVVASVPTLGRHNSERIKRFDPAEFDCVVADECHHGVSPQWKRVLDHFGLIQPGGRILSLVMTATPNRNDGTGLRLLYDEVVFNYGIVSDPSTGAPGGIDDGYLVNLKCWAISTKTNLDSVHVHA